MDKKCIYCKTDIPIESVIDFCERCGIGVWGEKMFKTIRDNMQNAHDRGDLRNSSSFVGELKDSKIKG